MMTLDQLLLVEDRALSKDEARELLAQIDAWCARHRIPDNVFGALACDFGGFVGLLRKRLSARMRMATLARYLIASRPDGVRVSEFDDMRRAAHDLLFQFRVPDPKRRLRPIAAPSAPSSAGVVTHFTLPPVVDRDPCPRCGVRGDIGCEHQVLA